ADDLLNVKATPGQVTEAGLRANASVGVRYIEAWLHGNGAAGINNLMEDAAPEISRSEVWKWVHNDVPLDTGEQVSADLVRRILDEEVGDARFKQARELFERVALADDFAEFLTLPAYDTID